MELKTKFFLRLLERLELPAECLPHLLAPSIWLRMIIVFSISPLISIYIKKKKIEKQIDCRMRMTRACWTAALLLFQHCYRSSVCSDICARAAGRSFHFI